MSPLPYILYRFVVFFGVAKSSCSELPRDLLFSCVDVDSNYLASTCSLASHNGRQAKHNVFPRRDILIQAPPETNSNYNEKFLLFW